MGEIILEKASFCSCVTSHKFLQHRNGCFWVSRQPVQPFFSHYDYTYLSCYMSEGTNSKKNNKYVNTTAEFNQLEKSRMKSLPWDCWEDWRTDLWTLHWLNETFWRQQQTAGSFHEKVLLFFFYHSNLNLTLISRLSFSIEKKKISFWSVPLAVCVSVQGPARWGGRPLFCDTEDLQALPLWTTAAMTRKHGGVHALPGWVLKDKNVS